MKKLLFFNGVTLSLSKGLIASISLLYLLSNAAFAFDSGSTGALGAFNPTTNTEVTLPADGILNYTTVDIPTGVTVTFKKNSANTPVYILATGDVTIAGTISMNGTDGSGIFPGKGGAGGFDGGLGGTPVGGSNPALPGGKGLGSGGGNPGTVSTNINYGSGGGAGGGFGSNGTNGGGNTTYAPGGTGGSSYGNAKVLPVIGGSGGGGGAGSSYSSYPNAGGSGGGGGGAILIASSVTITITGSITANGGKGANSGGSYRSGGGGGGSGGAIKLTANTISGNGTISANGGAGGTGEYGGGAGGSGRVRFEANTVTMTSTTTPVYAYSYPSTIFATNIPTLSITSVGGVNVAANPTGQYGLPDVTLPSTTTNPVTVNISATNIPVNTQVTVTSTPEYGASTSTSGTLSGTDASSTASASITLSTTYQNILTATATFTVQIAMYWDDEKIEKVRVATTMGKGSDVTYITEKGREIKAELLAFAGMIK